jgi:hypothetical protein
METWKERLASQLSPVPHQTDAVMGAVRRFIFKLGIIIRYQKLKARTVPANTGRKKTQSCITTPVVDLTSQPSLSFQANPSLIVTFTSSHCGDIQPAFPAVEIELLLIVQSTLDRTLSTRKAHTTKQVHSQVGAATRYTSTRLQALENSETQAIIR